MDSSLDMDRLVIPTGYDAVQVRYHGFPRQCKGQKTALWVDIYKYYHTYFWLGRENPMTQHAGPVHIIFSFRGENEPLSSMCVCVCVRCTYLCDIVSCAVGSKPCVRYVCQRIMGRHNITCTRVECVYNNITRVCRWGREKYHIIIIIYGMYRKRNGPASRPNLHYIARIRSICSGITELAFILHTIF